MAPLTEDIMAVRAQQGFDSGLSRKAFEVALAAGASEEKLNELRELVKAKMRQCQTLLKGTLRRCAMIAEPGELYCAHHKEHGYGVDGIEPVGMTTVLDTRGTEPRDWDRCLRPPSLSRAPMNRPRAALSGSCLACCPAISKCFPRTVSW